MTNDEFYAGIPETTMESLVAYRDQRRVTGGFLYAVLTNDLKRAVASADRENMAALKQITTWVSCQMPMGAQGSKEAVAEWLGGEE